MLEPVSVNHAQCQVCCEDKPIRELVRGSSLREALASFIRQQYQDWSPDGYICVQDLDRIKVDYIQRTIEADKGEITQLEEAVVKSIRDQELLSRNVSAEYDSSLTTGQRIADKVAVFGGSWSFIITFSSVLVVWIIVNSIALLHKPFDPYPFILLNLVLSSLAAFQAPIIMMSQNRQESKDRIHAEHDYQINLKAELEVRNLNQRLDHLINHQWQRLLEIQEIQTDLLQRHMGETK